ncbi:MAG: DUF2442 domain-containing protein [Arcicella sp.]|jgi:hypothetical protein|nr:DUF2442 domain-containing protein [Arcicella sp.]
MECRAINIWFDPKRIYAELTDGRVVGMPLSWFPRLEKATDTQRNQFEFWNNGAWIHWEELDEDLSADGFLTFQKKLNRH